MTAENVADSHGISRDAQDEFALESHRRAQAAMEAGRFDEEVVPIEVKARKGAVEFSVDEHVRRDASLETFAKLKPAFKKDGTVTAGNASGVNDAAAAVVLMSADRAKEQKAPVRARILSYAMCGVDPKTMGIGPVPAVRKALERAGRTLDDVDVIELTASRETIRQINVEGTLNAFRAAAGAGARRFVYASSIAAYGFHRDNPVGMTEAWPARRAAHLFYAQEKAEIERLLEEEAAGHVGLGVYLLRPPIVLGPDFVGAKDVLPSALAPLLRRLGGLRRRLRLPVIALPVPIQFIHQDDVGQAFLLCIVGAGPHGVYNITGDGVLSGAQVIRELGFAPIPAPDRLVRAAARGVAALPFVSPFAEWAEAFSHPAIMDASKDKQELGWLPQYSSLEALRDTLNSRQRRDARPRRVRR